jgi:sulfur carrier protein
MTPSTDREGPAGPLDVMVNGEALAVPVSTTLDGLIAIVGLERRGVAIAVDGQVVPRSAWRSSVLQCGARVEIVTAAAGG